MLFFFSVNHASWDLWNAWTSCSMSCRNSTRGKFCPVNTKTGSKHGCFDYQVCDLNNCLGSYTFLYAKRYVSFCLGLMPARLSDSEFMWTQTNSHHFTKHCSITFQIIKRIVCHYMHFVCNDSFIPNLSATPYAFRFAL